jgi:hypothetical protein
VGAVIPQAKTTYAAGFGFELTLSAVTTNIQALIIFGT